MLATACSRGTDTAGHIGGIGFRFTDGSGRYSLADDAGQVVVVNLWGSWCGPCKVETPQFEQVYQQTKADGVQFVGFDVKDSKSKAQAFVEDNDITYPMVYDQETKVALQLGELPVQGLPLTVLVDKQGKSPRRTWGSRSPPSSSLRSPPWSPRTPDVFARPEHSEASPADTISAVISHEQRVIFIHVPKAAGTSVEAALGHHAGTDVERGAQDHRSLRQLQWPHGGVRQFATAANRREVARAVKSRIRPPEHVANRTVVDRAQFRSYYKFGVVRNPWARTYSWYQNVLHDALHQQRLGAAPDIGFAEFVTRFVGTDLLQPQTHWLVDFHGHIGVDLVCRFETLDRDYAIVCDRAGLPAVELPHLNTGGHGTYLDAYDDRTRRLVAERYRDEIEAFHYAFAGEPAR